MIQIYDSLRGKKVTLDKQPGETVRMYVCGPTVYDVAHLGHGRSAVSFDLVRRFLEYRGYKVKFVSNITDVDDKIIERAKKDTSFELDINQKTKNLVEKIIPKYAEDYKKLGIKEPDEKPRASEYIKQMIELIQILEKNGHTYVISDGVYFDIKTFSEYGKLSHQNLDELNAGSRIEENTEKRNHQDFVLWKLKKDGEPFWHSPWGDGRPGWHIECSAMSATLLGETFDIHGGGLDLKFPHHECEIAQSEASSGKPLADIWMHNGYITVDEEKMSKSLGNFFTLEEIFTNFRPVTVRFFLLSTHYRSPIEFSHVRLEQAEKTLERLENFWLSNPEKDGEIDNELLGKITARMEDDFDVSGVWGLIFEWIHGNPKKPRKTLEKIDEFLNIFNKLFIFNIPEPIHAKCAEIERAREKKDYTESDRLRNELTFEGYEVRIDPDGTVQALPTGKLKL